MDTIAKAISFRPLAASDLLMLHEWLHRPHVSEWWVNPSTYAEVERDYLPFTTGESTTQAYIALLENKFTIVNSNEMKHEYYQSHPRCSEPGGF